MKSDKIHFMTVSQVIEQARDTGLDDYLESLKSRESYHPDVLTGMYADYWEDKLGWKFWEVLFNYIETYNIIVSDN